MNLSVGLYSSVDCIWVRILFNFCLSRVHIRVDILLKIGIFGALSIKLPPGLLSIWWVGLYKTGVLLENTLLFLIFWNLSSIFFGTKFSEIDFTFKHKFSQSSQFSFAESCWVYFCLKSLLKPIDFYGSKTPATKYSTSGAVFRKADILGYRFDRWH